MRKNLFKANAPANPLTEEYLRRKPDKPAEPPVLVRGDLSSDSIFDDENIIGQKHKGEVLAAAPSSTRQKEHIRNPAIMAAALDPDPHQRQRWERKMVIREIHKRGRLTKTQQLKRQERELVSKSHNIRTSLKKLTPLARQIAGKSIEEAIVQMRFSAKKASKEVLAHLEQARNEAVVSRGMGLGEPLEVPRKIVTNGGKRITVRNASQLYISQAWVGKGDTGQTPEYRARGRVNMLKHPSTRKFS